MAFQAKSWTVVRAVRWIVTGLLTVCLLPIPTIVWQENVKHLIHERHWDEYLSTVVTFLSTLPDTKSFWFVLGFLAGTALTLWLARFVLFGDSLSPSTSPAAKPALEILYDGSHGNFVRPIMGLHGERGEHFWVGVHNAGAQTLDEVVLLAQEGWFVEHTIAVAHPVFGEFGPKKARVPTVAKFPSLHPGVTEMVNLFGLNYQATPNKSDVLGNVRKFTLEAQARDVRTATAEFEYDPNRRPMVMRS